MVDSQDLQTKAVLFTIGDEAHVFLYLINNKKHNSCYGLIEDLYVEPQYRDSGLATQLLEALIRRAYAERCYKIIANSRFENEAAQTLYNKFGFELHGREYRFDTQII